MRGPLIGKTKVAPERHQRLFLAQSLLGPAVLPDPLTQDPVEEGVDIAEIDLLPDLLLVDTQDLCTESAYCQCWLSMCRLDWVRTSATVDQLTQAS